MAKGRLLVREVLPGPEPLRRAVEAFARSPGAVTALHEGRLRLLRALAPAGEEDVEVAPIGDLYGRCLAAMGESGLTIATHGQARHAIAIACAEEPEDSAFAPSARFAGLHDRLAQALGELRHWGLRAAELEGLAEDAPAPLGAKLRDLARIERRTAGLLEHVGKEFATERVERLLEGPAPRALPFRRLLIVAGQEAQPAVAGWLRWLASHGAAVEAVVEALPGGAGLFAGAEAWRKALGLPRGSGLPTGEEPWFRALFSDRTATEQGSPEAAVQRAADPQAECEWALRGCLEQIAAGVPPHRLGIVVRDAEAYVPLLLASAKRLGVPLSATHNVPLLTNGLAAWVLGLLEALAGRDVRALGRVARSSYVRLPREAQRRLDGLLGEAHRAPDPWGALERMGAEAPGWLREVLAWRAEAERQARPLTAWHGRLRGLLERPGLHEAVLDPASPTRVRDARAHTAMLRSLAEAAPLRAVAGERPLDLAGFAIVCRALWSIEETVAPAESAGGVRVAAAPELLEPMAAVWGLGMLEGVMPRRRVEDPVLGDAERDWISGRLPEGPPLPNSHQRAREERDAFVRLCAAAPRLTLSYPETGEDRDNVPAFYLDELERALGGRVARVNRPRRLVAPDEEECRSPADFALRVALDAPREDAVTPRLTSAEARSRLRAPLEEGIEPGEVADALRCAFLAGWRRRIGIFPAKERLWSALGRLPVRARLAHQPSREEAAIVLEEELRRLLGERAAESSPADLVLLETTGRRLIEGWLDREFGARELWPRTMTEEQTGVRCSLPVEGRRVVVGGSVAGRSRIGAAQVVHLFRTGLAAASEGQIDEALTTELGLWMLTVYQVGETQGVEVDVQGGGRYLFLATRDGDEVPRQRPQAGLVRRRFDTDRSDFYKKVKSDLRTAIFRLDPPSFLPEPGDACETCDLGELCRMSRDFGEALSPFDIGVELA
jgi:hypothetical protein